jgi:hypothetical protein
MATPLTVICREDGYPNSILIYVVKPDDPENRAEVERLVQAERANDIEDAGEMEILFAFEGDLNPAHDWRE